jgi:hypothetical protein
MEKFDHQGKRKDQVEFSEKVVFWGIIGMITLICLTFLYNFFTKL